MGELCPPKRLNALGPLSNSDAGTKSTSLLVRLLKKKPPCIVVQKPCSKTPRSAMSGTKQSISLSVSHVKIVPYAKQKPVTKAQPGTGEPNNLLKVILG